MRLAPTLLDFLRDSEKYPQRGKLILVLASNGTVSSEQPEKENSSTGIDLDNHAPPPPIRFA